MKIKWLQRLEKDRLDSVWYGGDMASIKCGDKTVIITAAGEVRVIIKGETYVDKSNGGRMREYLEENGIYTDEDLRKAEENGDVEFLNNNWFEIIGWDESKKDYFGDNFDNVCDVNPDDDFAWVEDWIKENKDF